MMNKTGGPDNTFDITGDIGEFVASKPLFGKHLLFGGDLLHAAPSSLIQDEEEEDEDESEDSDSDDSDDDEGLLRVTLLVNVWVNHIPIQSIQFPESQISELSTGLLALPSSDVLQFKQNQSQPQCTINLDAVNCSRTMLWKFSNSDIKYSVSCPLPEASTVAANFENFHLIAFKYTTDDVKVNISVDDSEDSEEDDSGDDDENEDGTSQSESSDSGSDAESESMDDLPAKKSRRW